MSEVTALAVAKDDREETALVLMSRANDVAMACRQLVLSLAIEIHGKRYVPVEAWASIAAAHGSIPTIVEVVEEERGVRAVAELRRRDGSVIARAEGFCGLDEPMWANRAAYARRAMAQTRAISRVCRTAFAFIVTMIDSKLQTTPLEEIPAGGIAIEATVVANDDGRPRAANEVRVARSGVPVPYGRSKGKDLTEISDSDLEWVLKAATENAAANDPKWGASNKKFLVAVQAEAARRISKR